MINCKEMKQRAKTSLKKHYVIFVIICILGLYLGSEFSSAMSVIQAETDAADMEDTAGNININAISNNNMGAMDVLETILQEGDSQAKKLSEDLIARDVDESSVSSNQFMGRSRGVLALVVNSLTSGALYVKLASGLHSIIKSNDLVAAILIVISLLFSVGIWFFLKNMYQVICRRIFLEGRVYKHVTMQRLLFLLRVKKWVKVSWTMFVAYLFETLWFLTIIGGIIKHYSYYLVPYIVAENPDIGALEAIKLSRRMMNGHKWECFVFNLSFLGWYILSLFTFGLLDFFFLNPYKQASYAEYYVWLRQLAVDQKLEGCELLDDHYLFIQADQELLQKTYADVADFFQNPPVAPEKRTGIRAFFANYLGIVFLTSSQERKREDWEAEELRLHELKFALDGASYPGRLSPIPEHQKRKHIETVNYLRRYTVWSLILMFFAFSFTGWVWEVSLHLIANGRFVNRGVLHGPWLPIYGSGGILILVLLYRLRKNPGVQLLATVILCGCVEYFTSWYLEMAHGQKWWDYSGYFLNINGRICAEGLFVFGMGGMAIVYAAAPLLDNYIKKIPHKVIIPLCIVLGALFMTDQIYSSKHPNTGHGITDYEAKVPVNPGIKQREEA